MIKLSQQIDLQCVPDGIDGVLGIAESGKNIPFDIKRVYHITGLENPNAVRGKHAHKRLKQAIFCVSGSFELKLDDGSETETLVLDRPARGVYLPPFCWHEMYHFSKACVILVFSSDHYDESDYIRDYREFKRIIQTGK